MLRAEKVIKQRDNADINKGLTSRGKFELLDVNFTSNQVWPEFKEIFSSIQLICKSVSQLTLVGGLITGLAEECLVTDGRHIPQGICHNDESQA